MAGIKALIIKLHIITIGQPKLTYARAGWQDYLGRLQHYHTVRTTHLADKWANDAEAILKAAGNSYKVALAIGGKQFSSEELTEFLQTRELEAREVAFIIGGPEGLPAKVITTSDFQWSLSKLTFPHDLAMLITLETLYRTATIIAGHPYHK